MRSANELPQEPVEVSRMLRSLAELYSARSGLRDVLLSEPQGASGLLIQWPFRS